jgi:hypothetical protein
MAKITWLGNVDSPHDEYETDAHCTWGDYLFPLDVPVEVTDPHIIEKARTNRFFRLQEDANGSGPDARTPEPAAGRVDDDGFTDDVISDQPFEPPATPTEAAPPKRSHKKKAPAP